MSETTKRPSIFKDPPGSVKTLRRFYKDRLSMPDSSKLIAELSGESDRASIILMASMLDEALTFRLSKALPFLPSETEYEEIFRLEGPLGTFSSRMEIACLFGFIEDETYQQLNIIREMRNACAHSKLTLTFAEPALANVAKRLFKPLGLMDLPAEGREGLKAAFTVERIFVYYSLLRGSRKEGTKAVAQMLDAARAPSPDKPTKP